MAKLGLAGLLLLVAACGGRFPHESSQFHVDGPSRGVVYVHSAHQVEQAWQADVGQVAFSSPAIGPDGTIYVGNLSGELVAVDPANGQIKWKFPTARRYPEPFINTSPAVSKDGTVYFIVTFGVSKASPRGSSVIFGIDPSSGQERWSQPFPLNAGVESSPKTFEPPEGGGVLVFVASEQSSTIASVFVFDAISGQLLDEQSWLCRHDLNGGFDFGSAVVGFPIPCVIGRDPGCFSVPLPEPTPAIIPVGFNPFVIVPINACDIRMFVRTTQALSGPITPALKLVWKIDNPRNSFSSPAVFVSGSGISTQSTLLIGRDDGHVLVYDPLGSIFGQGGTVAAQKGDYYTGEKVLSTPAFFPLVARGAYIPSISAFGGSSGSVGATAHLHYIDDDGTLFKRVPIPRTFASPVVTLDRVYISTEEGLLIVPFDLSFTDSFTVSGKVPAPSSPAVGSDGTIYFMASDHVLYAVR